VLTSTSTTTLPDAACANQPSVFESIACRLRALRDETVTTAALGTLRPKLHRAVDRAADRVGAAQGICSFGKAKPTRARLGRARRQLARYVRKLRGRAAEKSVPSEIRARLAAEADALKAEIVALRRRVVCPIDA
jgi:hypothetical protein